MALSVTGAVTLSTADGHGYLSVDVGVLATGLLTIAGSINTFPGGSSINPGISSPLIPGSSLGGSLLAPVLPPVLAPIVGGLLGSLPTGAIGGTPVEPPAGAATPIDFGGTILSLPGAFV